MMRQSFLFSFVVYSRNGHYWLVLSYRAITFIRFPHTTRPLDCRVNISPVIFLEKLKSNKRARSQLRFRFRLFIENDGSFDASSPIILYIIGKAIVFFVSAQPLRLFETIYTHREYSEKEYFGICRDQIFVRKKKEKNGARVKNFDRSITFLFFSNEKALRFFYRDKLLYFKIGFL